MDTQLFNVLSVFAVVPVSNLEAAIEWYAKLLGRNPDKQPAPNVAEYYLSDDRDPRKGTLQLMIDTNRAGGGIATVNVNDIEQVTASTRNIGIAFETQTYPIDDEAKTVIVVGNIVDLDGNSLNIVQPPRHE